MADLPKAYSGNEPYIFVSYAHANIDIVYPELTWLASEGVNVWYDEGITPGSRWSDSLAEALAGCAYFVLYVTENAASSHHCLDELNFALEQDKPVLAIHLKETPLSGGLALRLGARQAIHQFTLGQRVAHDRVLSFLDRLTNANEMTTRVQDKTDESLEILCSAVAVIPFQCRDENLLDLAEDLTESVEDMLTVTRPRMIGADETRPLRDKGMTSAAISEAVKVGVVVEGSLRLRHDRLQLTIELSDHHGSRFWSHRFSGELPASESDEHRFMNPVNWMIRRVIGSHIHAEVRSVDAAHLGPWGLFEKSIEARSRISGRQEARDLLRKAIEQRPGELLFRASLAADIAGDVQTGFSRQIEEDSAEAMQLITDAATFAQSWPVLEQLASALGFLMEFDRSVVMARRAVEMAPPGDTFGARWTLAFRLGFVGEVDEALAIYEEIDQYDIPIRPMAHANAQYYLIRGDVDLALTEAKAAVNWNSNPTQPYITLLVYANILAIKGYVEEAEETLARVRVLLPKFRLNRAIWSFARSFRDQPDKDAVTAGLRLLAELES